MGLSTSDIIGLVVGVVSAVIALTSAFIAYCTWQYPNSRIGNVGANISKSLSIRGGEGRGGHATGPGARGGPGMGGSGNAHLVRPKFPPGRAHPDRGNGDIEAQVLRGVGDVKVHGGTGSGGDAEGVGAQGGAGIGGAATISA